MVSFAQTVGLPNVPRATTSQITTPVTIAMA